jgi:hypothetical protein
VLIPMSLKLKRTIRTGSRPIPILSLSPSPRTKHFERLLEIYSAAANQRESWTGRLASRYARECDPACSVLEDRYWVKPLSRATLRAVCLDANNPSDLSPENSSALG